MQTTRGNDKLKNPVTTIPTEEENAFEEAVIAANNKYRVLHGVPQLKLNPKLTEHARNQAQICVKEGKMVHSVGDYGENIFMINLPKADAKELVEIWYSEIEMYDFDKPENCEAVGNFTQLVWKDTSEIGVGTAYGGGWLYVVANYSKAGNVPGLYRQNVLPLTVKAAPSLRPLTSVQSRTVIKKKAPNSLFVPRVRKVIRLLAIKNSPKRKPINRKSDTKHKQAKPVPESMSGVLKSLHVKKSADAKVIQPKESSETNVMPLRPGQLIPRRILGPEQLRQHKPIQRIKPIEFYINQIINRRLGKQTSQRSSISIQSSQKKLSLSTLKRFSLAKHNSQKPTIVKIILVKDPEKIRDRLQYPLQAGLGNLKQYKAWQKAASKTISSVGTNAALPNQNKLSEGEAKLYRNLLKARVSRESTVPLNLSEIPTTIPALPNRIMVKNIHVEPQYQSRGARLPIKSKRKNPKSYQGRPILNKIKAQQNIPKAGVLSKARSTQSKQKTIAR